MKSLFAADAVNANIIQTSAYQSKSKRLEWRKQWFFSIVPEKRTHNNYRESDVPTSSQMLSWNLFFFNNNNLYEVLL